MFAELGIARSMRGVGQGGWKGRYQKRNQGAPVIVCDQELKKGNLALAKNHARNVPVRVIRGHRLSAAFLGYSYDGLYSIVSYEFSEGINGFKVYKYTMARVEGQPPIPPCIKGCTSHPWNTASSTPSPLQAVDHVKPNLFQLEMKPVFMETPVTEMKPMFMQGLREPRVEVKQELCQGKL